MKEKQLLVFHFFGPIPSDRIPKAKKDVNEDFLFTVEIPVNYTSELLQLFEATMCTQRV